MAQLTTSIVTLATLQANPEIDHVAFLAYDEKNGCYGKLALTVDIRDNLEAQGAERGEMDHLEYLDAVTCAKLGVQCRVREHYENLLEEYGVVPQRHGFRIGIIEEWKEMHSQERQVATGGAFRHSTALAAKKREILDVLEYFEQVYLLLTQEEPFEYEVQRALRHADVVQLEIVFQGLLVVIERKMEELEL